VPAYVCLENEARERRDANVGLLGEPEDRGGIIGAEAQADESGFFGRARRRTGGARR